MNLTALHCYFFPLFKNNLVTVFFFSFSGETRLNKEKIIQGWSHQIMAQLTTLLMTWWGVEGQVGSPVIGLCWIGVRAVGTMVTIIGHWEEQKWA